MRNIILAVRKSLRLKNAEAGSDKIFINEHLTGMRADIFVRARAIQKEGKIVVTWTMNGTVTSRSKTPTEIPKKISSLKDLMKI